MSNEKMNKPIIIGVDHGFAMMKYAHGTFPNGLKRIQGEASLENNTLVVDGQTYKIGEGRLPMKEEKTSDEDYFILTLASVCKEMKFRGLKQANVILAVGLPFSRFGIERKTFHDYLKREGLIQVSLDGEDYEIGINEVFVYPQCYAAIANRIGSMEAETLVVDIGSKTVDVIHFVDRVPQESESTSWPKALIECTESIKNEVYSQLNRNLTDTQIQKVMLEGDNPLIPEECVSIIRGVLHQFVESIEAKLRENGFEIDMIPIIYVGGGAGIMRRFRSGSRKNVTYIEDICANAIGYEYLCSRSVDRG